MGTTLELAREIRDYIVHHATGRLQITFDDVLRQVDFSDGTIVTGKADLLASLDSPPLDWDFLRIEIPEADEAQSGAAVLVEALDALTDDALNRIWEPYRKWTILLSQDPEIHQTTVSEQIDRRPARLGKLLRLAVTGAARLEPPARLSLEEQMEEIRTATARGNYWDALGIDRAADREAIKHAHRELARQFHPDRWHGKTNNEAVRNTVAQAFRDVQYCYERALKAAPRRLKAVPPIPQSGPEVPIPGPATVAGEPDVPELQPVAPAVTSYTTASAAPNKAPDTLFRRIFDRFFKAA